MQFHKLIISLLALFTWQISEAQCTLKTAPYSEDFESTAWANGGAPQAAGDVDTCWSRIPVDEFFFKTGPNPTAFGNTGATNDHTKGTSSGQYLYSATGSLNFANDTAEISSPPIDISNLTNPQLSFWYHMYGNEITSLETFVSNDGGQTYSRVKKTTGQQQTSKTAAWKDQIIDLQSYANDTIQVKFRTVRQRFDFNVFTCIDDFAVAEKPSCPKPSNFTLDYVTNNSANFSWTSGGANDWELEYGSVNFTPGNGTRVSRSSNPAVIGGFQANRRYDVYLRDSCAPGDVSAWVGPLTIRTLCNPVFFAPFIEDFDGNNFGPVTFQDADGKVGGCWRRGDVNGDYLWSGSGTISSFFSGPSQDHTSGAGDFAVTETINFTNQADSSFLETPLIITTPLDTPQLSFWYHMYGSDIRKLEVYARNLGSTYTLLQTINGQQQTNNTDAWKEAVVKLSNYANDTIQIKFVGYNNRTSRSRIAIDDVQVDSLPSCPRPSNFSLTKLNASSATFSWTSGGAAHWQLEYGTPGHTAGNGTIVNKSSNPATLSGLSANTTYDIYVRDSCGANDFSEWVGPVTITTPCVPVTAPWVETFQGNAFTTGSFFNNGTINNCYSRDENSRFIWLPTSSNLSFSSGASNDHTLGNNNGMYMTAGAGQFNSNFPNSTSFTTPAIDVTALTTPELTFWYHMFGAQIDSLQVQAGSATFQRVFSLTGQKQNATGDAWKKAAVDLASFANDTFRIRFVAYRNPGFGFNFNSSIDDLDVHEKPTCPEPKNLTLNAVTSSSASVGWTSGGATNWQIEYGTRGFNKGSGTLVNAGSNPFTISGLSANTAYDIYVRDSCGAGDVSLWHGPLRTTTLCNPLPAPWIEDFESSSFVVRTFFNIGNIDNCFSRDTTNRYVWMPETNSVVFSSGPSGDHTTGSGTFMVAASGPFATSNLRETRFLSPLIDLSPLNTPELSFWYHMYGSDIDSLQVEVNNGANWQYALSVIGQQQTSSAANWLKAIVDLSNYANDTIQLRYTAYRSTNFSFNQNISIDDLDIHEQPSCPQPKNVQATGSTTSSITLSWTTGGATNWQIEYGSAGFTPGTGTLLNATTNPYTVTGLNAATSYDFYLRDSCGTGNTSLFTMATNASTSCGVVTAPIKENFDSAPFAVPATFSDTGKINGCWNRTTGTSFGWEPGPNAVFNNPNTGPSADHTSGNGQYLNTRLSGFATNASTDLTTYSIDVSGLTKPELVFWYHMYGNKISDLEVEVDDGTGFTNEWTKSGEQQTSAQEAWKEAIVDLSSYSSDTIRIKFIGKTNAQFSFSAEIAIDDFWVREAPTCPKPTAVNVSSSTQTSLTLNWTSGGATNWLVGYRLSGSTGAYTYLPTASNPYTITGLSPSSNYDIVVKDSCSTSDVSFATIPINGRTQCGVASAPYFENFDNTAVWDVVTDSIDPCWKRNPGAGNNPTFTHTWLPNSGGTPSFGSGPDSDASGNGQYIFTNSRGGSGAVEITGPQIFIPSNLQNPKLFFKYHMYGFRIDSLILKVNNGGGWNTNNISIAGQQQTSSTAPWAKDSLDLTNFKGDTIQLRFRGVSSSFSFRADMAVDEIEIIGNLIPCNAPDSLWVTNIGQNSADVNITSDTGSTLNLSYYEITAGPNADTLLKNVSSPVNLSGLSPGTTYVVNAYDSCAANLFSSALSDTFTTVPCDTALAAFSTSQSFLSVNTDGSATQKADTLVWEWGDGTTQRGTATNASHTYASAGTYTITLTAFNICGSTDTATQTVTVCDSISDPGFSLTQVRDSISLRPNTLDPNYKYIWDFGDGSSSNSPLVNHTYSSFGTFTVTLTLVNSCNDSISTSQTVSICEPAVASWFFTVVNSVNGQLTIDFDGTASQNANTYEWDFDDGTFGTGSKITHSYSTPGLFYEVSLTVKNSCSSDKLKFRLADRVSLEEISIAGNTLLYPNPSNGKFTIEWPVQLYQVRQLQLTNSAGQLVMQQAVSNKAGRIHVAVDHLPKGLYQVHIKTSKGQVVKKLLVQ